MSRLTLSFEGTNAHIQGCTHPVLRNGVSLAPRRIPVNQIKILPVRGDDVFGFNVIVDDAEGVDNL